MLGRQHSTDLAEVPLPTRQKLLEEAGEDRLQDSAGLLLEGNSEFLLTQELARTLVKCHKAVCFIAKHVSFLCINIVNDLFASYW